MDYGHQRRQWFGKWHRDLYGRQQQQGAHRDDHDCDQDADSTTGEELNRPAVHRIRNRRITTIVTLLVALVLCGAQRAAAQSLRDVLSFLLTNRSIVTDDFVRDQQAARATSDTISALLGVELGTLPTTTSAGGFIYRFDPELGVSVRVTDSFGPFFTERAMTAGSRQVTFGLRYHQASFNRIDGRSLRDGTLVSTASRLHGASVPFDVETLTLRLRTDTVTALTNVGLTDRLDVGAALPVQRITLSGRRIDNYRGREATQAQAEAVRTGPSDIVVQTKYMVMRRNASGIALAGVARLPTGDENNLLGAGRSAFILRAIGSSEGQRTSLHGNLDYAVQGLPSELR